MKKIIVYTHYNNSISDDFTGIIEWPDGTRYYNDGEYHRIDGPAIEYFDGTKVYYVNGKRHRIDGPAHEWPNGIKRYYINDKQVTKEAQELLHNLMKLKGLDL